MKFRLVTAAFSLLTLTACEAQVSTSIEVTSADTARIEASVVLTGEAAEVVGNDPTLDRSLTELVDAVAADKVRRDRSDQQMTWRTTLTYEELAGAADRLGVSGLRLSTVDEGTVRADVEVSSPTGLLDAYTTGVADQPDAEVLADTLAAATRIDVEVTFPGGVDTATFTVAPEADASQVAASREGDTVRISQHADRVVAGTLTVQGNPDGGRAFPFVPAAVAGAVIGTGALLAFWYRHR